MTCSTSTVEEGKRGAKILMLLNGQPVSGAEIEVPTGVSTHGRTVSKTRILKLRQGDRITFELRIAGQPRPKYIIPVKRANVDVQMLRWW
jgi:hypothetical protein